MQGIEVSPGLCRPMIETLGDKAKKNPTTYSNVALMLDAMAIRKKITRDPKSQTMTGFVNLGDGCDSDLPASEALVVMVVGLREHWKAPVAYYLTRTLTAETQAQLIRHTLEALAEVGIRVWTITMDGHSTNQAMCAELGCCLEKSKPYFPHPKSGDNVFILFDACHMLKLARNLLGDYSIIKSPDGVVRWSHLANLQDVQEEAGLRLGNRLSTRHLNFHKMKMKVNLAAQTFSASVASALQCLHDAGHSQFSDCLPTVKFIQVSFFLITNFNSFFITSHMHALLFTGIMLCLHIMYNIYYYKYQFYRNQ
jgi:hypothetical protein